ncbi:membrane-bound O-acyltransferase family protein [Paenibacillus odorifer]|uniref:MBOAT family O-acyltransferase n=1 Tax=Paenibacillus TaxID=44249 RepID=UPI00096E472F|nr:MULTISPECIES: MBOAT family O-acyltransferase [Paenibacillus]MDH6427637.1 alginate O-acetyltransferase complex protein AlgI [Paenibacillus sp. PastH-4]MDH6444738.1 alginate O-acetyltransferase complex protein AlgI [Paenibacillus sp. PastF-4]MDH6528634.1 alginate O-acetyltransferase complex protein AlgI [Paenibacillus sp. PastH-3]OMD63640.1 membrane-bound O-acyltransferase family protein [Paenibacillus odorifer]OMD72824.1 membrane-bound O-acyltransferase family protein [Paenibacillus odorifer
MLFNSYPFMFGFLPIVLAGYFILNRLRLTLCAKVWLTLASLVFYGYWNIKYVPLILLSILFNYVMGHFIHSTTAKLRRPLLIFSLSTNILLLSYYKYTDFFIENWNEVTASNLSLHHLILPLGISFFTFTQIAYLVDVYRNQAREYNLLNYTLFVTFFPHLISGPILHHKDMMPQFDKLRNKVWNWNNIRKGTLFFSIGLGKKVILADTLAGYADNGFAAATYFVDSWVAILSYTLQIYYDFSGYTDMAIGIALLFNIHLPQNFNEPYRAVSIRDFWRRWHITLSHFLRDYIYIPLGGNRKSFWISIRNVIITFLLGGFWHGAGWLFILWGLLHGVGQAVEKCWGRWGFSLPKWLSWLLTFIFVNITWVFFRAEHISQAFRLLKGMSGLNGVSLQSIGSLKWAIILILILMTIILWNPLHLLNKRNFQYSWKTAFVMAFIIMFSLLFFNRITTFLYFNF